MLNNTNRNKILLVNTSQAGQGKLKAELVHPSTSVLPCRCHVYELNKQEYIVQYIPNEPGRYQLGIFFNNQLIQGKIMHTDVYSILPPLATSSFPIINIQKILPNHLPQIGDDICLQSSILSFFLNSFEILFYLLIVITDKTSLHAQILCNGIDIPCRLQQTKDKHIWYLKFQSFVIGNYHIHLVHNGVSIMSK